MISRIEIAAIALGISFTAGFARAQAPGEEKLRAGWEEGLAPGVNSGLAAKYAGDAGIERDPQVCFAENFESGKVLLPYKEGNALKDIWTVTEKTAFLGKFSAEKVWGPGGVGRAGRVWFPASAHQRPNPCYFLRAYRKFDKSFFPDDTGKAVGLKGMGICCLKAKFDGRGGTEAGGSCDGTDWYTVEDQFVGWAGRGRGSFNGYYWLGHMYSYMPFPNEVKFDLGDSKINKPPTTRFSVYGKEYTPYDKWTCFELGLYLNTPGKRDGEARYWIDGVLQSHTTHMCFRTVENALPEVATFNLYRTTPNFPQPMTLWMDNIVIAMRYIGPARLDGQAPPPTTPAVAAAPSKEPAPPNGENGKREVPSVAIDVSFYRAGAIARVPAALGARRERVFLKVMGSLQPVFVKAADAAGMSIELDGNTLPLRWKDLDDLDVVRLGQGVFKADAEGLYQIGALAAALKADQPRESILDRLSQVDAARAVELADFIAGSK